MTRAAALRSAVSAWRALPASVRNSAQHNIRMRALMFDNARKDARARGLTGLARMHRNEAAALRAAVKLLRAAGRSK